MDVQNLLNHLAGVSWPGLGALFVAWLVWQLWRRLFRAALVCAVVGLVLYVAFPGAAHELINEVTHATVPGGAGSPG